MPLKIFISAAPRDFDLARDLEKRLNKAGLKVISPAPAKSVKENVRARIDGEALRAADEVIALLTKNSVDSPWLLYEIGFAASLGKQVTPLIQGIELKEVPGIIKQMEYVKYAGLDKYISKLQRRAEELSKSAA
jgi:nucleoside 2-deoxyribosyltransferase